MATQIHGFGPNGELSPGAEAALNGLGGGGGYPVQYVTATGDVTIDSDDWPTTEVVTLVITQDSTGGHTVSLPSAIVMAAGLTWDPGTDADTEATAVFRYSTGLGAWVCEGVWISVGELPGSTGVTPTEPTFTDLSGTADDEYTIPAQAGVVYRVGGVITSAGDYTPSAGATVAITAEADSGYTIATGATTSWEHTFSTAVVNTAPSMTLGTATITGLEVSQPFTTSDADDDTVTVTADWDDGTTPGVVTSPAVHTYSESGTYDATFTPHDGTEAGAVRTATYTVSSGTLPPVGDPATLADAMTDYGAVGYWKLDETTGTTITDYSGNGRHGTLVGTPTTDYVLAGQNGFLQFVTPGAGQPSPAHVNVSHHADFNIPVDGALTVFACAYQSSVTSTDTLVRKGIANGDREWQHHIQGVNLRGIVTELSGTYIAQSDTNNNVYTSNTWHAGATILPRPGGADVPVCYVDSGTPQPVTTNTQTGTYTPDTDVLRLGATMVGGLAHVAVFPYALTDAHIQKLVDLARGEGVIP